MYIINILKIANMFVWYNTLLTWQQYCLWGLLILSVAGIIRVVYMCCRVCWFDKRLVLSYIENAERYARKFRNNINNAVEGEFIIRKSNKVSQILGESFFDMPALEYAGKIKSANVYDVSSLDDLVRKTYANYLKWDENRKKQKNILLLHLFLPFVFWPFRGIELLLIFLSEALLAMGIKTFKADGKFVLVLSTIGGVLGFIGNIASILSFLGISL